MNKNTPSPDTILAAMYKALNKGAGVPEEDWQTLIANCDTFSVDEKTLIQRSGDPVDSIYFMTHGLVRVFYISSEGKQHNKAFYKENNFVGSLSILLIDEAARFSLETLENSSFVAMPISTIKSMLESSEFMRTLILHSSLKTMARNERREAEFLMLSTQQRYQRFAQNFPDLIGRIPQYHIASYLGVTPVALSRYKKQWS